MRLLRLGLLTIAVLALSCGRPAIGSAVVTHPSFRWDVSVHADLSLDERICWSGFVPGHIRPEMPAALPFVHASNDLGATLTLDSVGLPAAQKSGCVHLAIDLDAMARSLDAETAVMRIGDAIYGSFDPWLWRPGVWPDGLRGRLYIRTPKDISVSVPHQAAADGSWEIRPSTWTFMARAAIGQLKTDEVRLGADFLDVVTLPNAAPSASSEGIRKFVRLAASAAASLDRDAPQMPVRRVQVLLLPGRGNRGDPIQFGMAMRGGGASVALRISPNAKDSDLLGEWIATHELSHLWLPPVERDGIWLSEGLASYNQCVLRSRVGAYDERHAWDELLHGFDRGREQAGTLPLREARRPHFQHIYWGGAAVLFKLDVALRKERSSLDAVVASIRRATPSDDEESTVDDMLVRFERAAGKNVRERVLRWLEQPFVDVSTELRELGILRRGDEVVLDNSAPLARLRAAIAGALAQ